MHGASYISGASCARATWLGLISTLKIRLEPLVVLPRCEGEWCWCYPLRTRGNSTVIIAIALPTSTDLLRLVAGAHRFYFTPTSYSSGSAVPSGAGDGTEAAAQH
eukprot:COSAG06_NODE_9529_length_1878_cov_5.018550_3_plen_105_part_00